MPDRTDTMPNDSSLNGGELKSNTNNNSNLIDQEKNTTNLNSEQLVEKEGKRDFVNIITGVTFFILGIIGVILSGIITVEKMALLEDAQHTLSCSFNEAFSCGNVMSSPEASAFGFPNMIIGLVGFGIVSAIGAGILAGAKYKPWFWFATILGLLFAVIFSHWLFYSAVYIIGSLCIYCMGVWAVSIALFMNALSFVFKKFAPPTKGITIISNILTKWWWLLFLAWYGILMLLTYIQFT